MPALTGETPVMACGSATLTMIVNLKRFVKRGRETNGEGIDLFEQIRGTDSLADFLHTLPHRIHAPFVVDDAEADLMEAAHQMRIFRGYVLSQFFFPTYRLDEQAFLAQSGSAETDQILIDTIPDWDFQIMITRNGFAIVRMTRHFVDVPLSTMATEVQKLERTQHDNVHYSESRSSWRIAMDVTATFLESMGGAFILDDNENRRIDIQFDPEQRKGRLPLHDRYTTFHLSHVYRDGKTISPDDVLTEYGSFALGMMRLATTLRGGAANDMRRRRPVLPDDLMNLSPWCDDLCLVTNDAMLVYALTSTDAPDVPEELADTQEAADTLYTRAQFWQGVARGVEWLVNVKTEWQLLERQSTEMLSTVSTLTARVNDGLLDTEDKRRLRLLALGVSQAFNLLPELRYALVPSSITHATDAVSVYTHMLDQIGAYRIADHVNANVEELNAFLTYYSSTQIQYETREQEESENRTGLTISIMLILLSLVSIPSLIKDASEIDWTLVMAESPLELVSITFLALLPIILLIGTAVFVFRTLRR